MSESSREQMLRMKTAGIIIIGDEVLKGQILDLNTHYLCKEFYSLGVKVAKVSIIGDGVDEIASEVRYFSDKFDFVVTTGGVGPTHDDITYEGIAKAFDEKLVKNADMSEMIEKWLGHKGYSNEIIMRMAQMPSSVQLIFDPDAIKASFPIVNVKNVYVFPGIPQYLRNIFPRLHNVFKGNVFHNRFIYVNRDEMSITPHLDEAVDKFKETVVFGSYPVIGNLYYSTRLTLESSSGVIADEANSFLSNLLPPTSIVDFDSEPLKRAMEKVYAISEDKDHALHHPVNVAVQVIDTLNISLITVCSSSQFINYYLSLQKIEECLSKYDLSNLCICFNGGKDCTALLHVFYAVLQKKLPRSDMKIPALCIRNTDPFPEMEAFIMEATERYARMHNSIN